MTDIEVDPYDLSDGQVEDVDRLVLRDDLARTMDPEAFKEHPIERRSSIAAIQWAARRHMALEAADKAMPWLAEHDREVALKCAERALEWVRADFEGPQLPGIWEFVRDGLGTEWREHER